MLRAVQSPAVRVTQGRDVYRCHRKIHGVPLYYAITSDGRRFGPIGLRHGETEADLVVRLADRLDQEDPVLRLVRDDDAGDRVSPSHCPVSEPAASHWFWMHGLRPLVRERVRSPRLSVSGPARG